MFRTRRRQLVATAILLASGCSDPVAQSGESDQPDAPDNEPSLSLLIVSEPQWVAAAGGIAGDMSAEVAYVSAAPGALPGFVSAVIRNPARSEPGVTVFVAAGGFDPVAIAASAGDQLELALKSAGGAVSMAYARVPPRRPPVVVRTFPAKGRTDVALGIIPTVIFSEPIDARTLARGVRLFRGDEEMPLQVELLPGQAWEARLVLIAALQPETSYELRITRAVRDLDGDSLTVPVTVPFATDTAGAPTTPVPDFASQLIVSEAIPDTRSGETLVHVSAPSGALPGVYPGAFVVNLRTNQVAISPVPGHMMVDGFEPAVLGARTGDSLMVRLLFAPDQTVVVFRTVPERQEPVLLRITPPDGHENVPLETFPTLVFSEPIDSSTLASAVRLVGGSNDVAARLQVLPQAPWSVQVVPVGAPTLEPAMVYQLHVAQSIRDLQGQPMAASQSATFTTVPAPASPGPAPIPPADSRIAFSSNRSGFDQVFVARADGSDGRVLADGFDPRWAPSGDRLLFMLDSPDSTWHIRVVEEDGSGERFVAHGIDPSWSPDGTRILYAYRDLYSVAADGSGAELLLAGDSLERRAGWWWELRSPVASPDGTVAFLWRTWNGIDGSPQQIWLIDADGSDPRPVGDARVYADDPAWSPDGTRIAYTAGGPDGEYRTIRSMRADGSDPRVHFMVSDALDHVADLDWSPDGRYIAFAWARFNPYGSRYRIHVVDVETGAVGQLVPGVSDAAFPNYSDAGFSWSRVTP